MIWLLIIIFYITWLLYLAVMSLKRERTNLSRTAVYLAMPILVLGYVMDAVFNLTVGTVLFLEIPKEVLFTSRCNRWIPSKTWRGKVARWFCRNLLDPFDNGKHCR